MREIPFAGIELTSQRVRGLRGTSELPGRPAQCRIQILRELGSDLGTRHLLQVGRSAERRLHSYVDRNSSGCYSVYELARGTPRSTGTLPSLQPALFIVAFRGMSSTIPMEYYCFPSRDIRPSVLRGLQATHRPTLAGLLLPSYLIVVSLLGCVWNSGTAPVDVYR